MKKIKINTHVKKIIVIIALILLLIVFLPFTYSKFTSSTKSDYKIDAAYYILNPDYQVENLRIGELIPQDDPFIYRFTISNFKGTKRLETKLKYNLKIKTTTNLPLTFRLYLNNNHDVNIISNEEIIQDEYGTYFRYLTLPEREFNFNEDSVDTYELYITFPSTYDDKLYQDIVELIELDISSKQVIKGE